MVGEMQQNKFEIYVKECELEGQLSPAWVKKKWENQIHGVESSPHQTRSRGLDVKTATARLYVNLNLHWQNSRLNRNHMSIVE
ncbi:hypothetical protein J4Q44_G00196940 [Coregonus suidteri]|uniref:Uncharacterized protein n=1 Tax=Coregonus suidteri TaxID=861788 RepID=A0AAN8QSV3_9TELE